MARSHPAARPHRWLLGLSTVLACSATLGRHAAAAGPSVVVMADSRVDLGTKDRIEGEVSAHRDVKPLRPLPPPRSESPEDAANAARVKAVELALGRARQHESEAAWDGCATEAAGALGDAIELLGRRARFDLLRELHSQIGVCMSLGPTPANAEPHFLAATLLDESPPETGRHREEAEQARARARESVLGRLEGEVRIETDPAGAEVWIDGRRMPGLTPLVVHVRLGDHFVTLRRFRYEPRTERRMLHPGSSARFVLDTARRETLRTELSEVGAGTRAVSPSELRLGRATWSNAAQIVWLSHTEGADGGTRVALQDVTSAAVIRTRVLPPDADDDVLRDTVCGALGEVCEPPDEGIPWYVWPITGVAVVGAAVAIGFIADSARPTLFCPSGGCQ
jgi:hypothetical protein